MQALGPQPRRGLRPGLVLAGVVGLALLVGVRLAGGGQVAASETAASELHLISSPGQGLAVTLRQAGLNVADANGAAFSLAEALNPDHPPPGLDLDLKVERAEDEPGLRLIQLVLRRGDKIMASLTRAADGSLRLTPGADGAGALGGDQEVGETPAVLAGPMEDVLYGDANNGDAVIILQAARLFARKLDLTRDVALGDAVRLVFTRRVAADGRVLGPGHLLYAEIDAHEGPTRFYAHRPARGGELDYVDETGGELSGGLLRTPLDRPRVTSDFGMRLHPLLGYTRMHQGVDFGAPVGTAVVAASDGVVEEARWAGGYGRWIKLRHSASLETAYGHLSAWADGLRDGVRIRQGQVIGYVGSTGLSTGPHLHFEVIDHGRPVDPRSLPTVGPTSLGGADLAVFKSEKQRVARLLDHPQSVRLAQSGAGPEGGR